MAAIKNVDATHFAFNGVSLLKADYFPQVIEGKSLKITKVSDGSDLLTETPFDQITDATSGDKIATLSAFATFVATVFGLSVATAAATAAVAGLVKKAAAVANTAAAQTGAYVQADVQSILTELRALKTSLQAAGILS